MSRSKVRYIFYVFIFCFVNVNLGAETKFNLEYVTDEQGLEDSSIEKIVQDHDGYIWFGTQNGLFKYDGKYSKKYTNDGKEGSLLSADVYDVLFTKFGQMWVATSTGGLSLYDKNTDKFENYFNNTNPQVRHYKIKELIEYNDDVWYIDELGIVKYELKNNLMEEVFYLDDQIKNRKTYIAKSLTVFNGHLLAVINKKLCFFDENLQKFVLFKFKNIGKFFYSEKQEHYNIFNDNKGNLYVYTNVGLFFVDINNETILKESLQTQNSQFDRILIRDILTDSYGTVWIITQGHGVFYKLRGSKKYSKLHVGTGKSQLNTDQVFSIFEDRTNNIWLGTDGFYVAKYRTLQAIFPFYSNFNLMDQLHHTNAIWTFEEFNNNLYIGSDNGVFKVVDSKNDTEIKPVLISEKYRVVYDMEVVDDYMLIGGLNGLFGLMSTGETADFNPYILRASRDNNRVDNSVTQLAQSQTHIFVGTFSGLIAIEKTDFSTTYFNTQNADEMIQNGAIMSLAYSKKDDLLWIGTETGVEVISLLENSSIDNINKKLKSINGFVNDIHIDQDNSVWIAVDNTLFRFSSEGILIEYNHFPDNEVRSIETLDGVIWMTTPTGMIKTTINNLEDYKYYVYEDGLYNKGNTTMASLYSKTRNELMFGGDVGFVKFAPDFDIPHTQNINPKMNEINLLNVAGEPDITDVLEDKGELKYFENNLRFEFAYLDYKAPKKNRFQFKLDGFDNDWSSLSNKNEATYTNLKSGKYVFRVKAFDANNVQSKEELIVDFRIKNPWWASKLAYLIYFLSVIGFFFMFSKWQKKEQSKQKDLQLQKNKEEFINGYNRYVLSLAELKSHQTLVRKFLDQVRLISGIKYLRYQQYIYDSILDISVGVNENITKPLNKHDLVVNNSTAKIKTKKIDSNSYMKVEADVQILFQQMHILQRALIDRQKYNRNDYFSSATGLYEFNVFKAILEDEFDRAKIHSAKLEFIEWYIAKSQFRDNELLKRIQLLGYGDQIRNIFSGHVLAAYSEEDENYSRFIIFLGEENPEQVEKYKSKLEVVLSENLKEFSNLGSDQQYLKSISIESGYDVFLNNLK